MKIPRIVFLSTGSFFSLQVATELLKKNILPVAFALPGHPSAPHSSDTFAILQDEIFRQFHQLIKANSVPILYARKNNDTYLLPQLNELNLDYLLVACWPDKLSMKIISCSRDASLNIHPSMLPKFRGTNPISEQLATEDKKFGVSLHLLNDRLDEGEIVLQQQVKVSAGADRIEIEKATALAGVNLFARAINNFGTENWRPIKQNQIDAS